MITVDSVKDRLSFAKRRLSELQMLNHGDIAGANPKDRQQLLQEFLFHLVGAIEFIAQVINDSLSLEIPANEVSARGICKKLESDHPLKNFLCELYPNTRNIQLPSDHYSDQSSHIRILVLRHWVCHRGHNPFFFREGATPRSSLFLDPRNRSLGASNKSAVDELKHFWQLVATKCERIINLLGVHMQS